MLQSKNNKYYSHKHTNIITSIINKVIIAMLIISAITCMNPIGTYGHTIKASKGITLRNSKKKDIPKGKMKITDIPRDLIADAAIDVQNIKSIDDKLPIEEYPFKDVYNHSGKVSLIGYVY